VDLSSCTVSGNQANGTVVGKGGGIYTVKSTLAPVGTTVKGNKATTADNDIFNGP
jgi:predicted outer membrane repeat protein